MIDDIDNYNMEYKKSAKEYFAKSVESNRKTDDTATMTKYAGLLKIAPLSDVKYDSSISNKSAYSASLGYNLKIPGFIYSLTVYLDFDIDSATNSYLLTKVNFY